MFRIILLVFLLLWNLHLSISDEDCEVRSEGSGRITHTSSLYVLGPYNPFNNRREHLLHETYNKCWTIEVPKKSLLLIDFTKLEFNGYDCPSVSLQVIEMHQGEEWKETEVCTTSGRLKSIIASHDVKIKFFQDFSSASGASSFELSYHTEDILCFNEDSFHCSPGNCVSKDRVCNGANDCLNGLDEKSCETGVFVVEGINKTRRNATTVLKKDLAAGTGWKNNLHRTIVSLYLAGELDFTNAKSIYHVPQELYMRKELELETAVRLLRNSTDTVSPNQLSMLINGLLVTCINPRYFYGFNLVQLLKVSIEINQSSIQPIVSLALCNARETLPDNAVKQLINVLSGDSEYLFIPDLQAVAFMAVACAVKSGQKNTFNETELQVFEDASKKFKSLQNADGSFGNVYTTALVAQALISNGEENTNDWRLKECVKFLINHLNSATTDYLATYLILPVLNGKSLVDVGKVNCTDVQKHSSGNPISVAYKLGKKMRIQYSLYIGDNKDVIHTIYLSVPKNISAYDVMQLAAVEDPKYEFEWKSMSNKIYVYEIDKFTNDPEAGLFWLVYFSSPQSNSTLTHIKTSPDEIEVKDNDHLIMWYKTADFDAFS